MKAIIAGTGFDKDMTASFARRTMETRYGRVGYMEKDGLVLLPRHGEGHRVPPHAVPYLANVEALSLLGVTEALGLYAVGGITEKLGLLEYGTLSDFIDFTGRNITFFSDCVRHTSMSAPYDREITDRVLALLPHAKRNLVYICTNGPRFETKAEIRAYGMMGADCVGMTGSTEAVLMREKGIRFASLVYSINWAEGIHGDIAFPHDEEIEKVTGLLMDAAIRAMS